MLTVSLKVQDVAKQMFVHRLATLWRRTKPRKLTTKELVKRAPELGLFVAEARSDFVYVPRQRVADREVPPLILARELDVFYETADKVIADISTMLRYERLFTIWQALANTRHIAGAAMAEIGVWRGGMSYLMAQGRRQFAGDDAPLIAIDTFEGHPGETIDPERDPYQRAGDFSSTSQQRAEQYLSEFPKCQVMKGEVTKLLPTLPERQYFLVHIDTDIYASTADCVRYFYCRLVPGGILVIDDFGAKHCPGVAQAIHDWLPSIGDCHVWQMRTEQCLITKLPRE